MAISERLALLIDINGAAAVSELNKVGSAADRELGKAEDRTQRMGTKFQQVGVGMMATAATIGVGLYQAGKGAAELEQTVGGTEAVFKSSAGVIDTWAKGADTAAGLSEQSARRLTTQIGGALQGLGFAQDQAAAKSIELTQIGADLSATYGGTTVDAVQALGSALRGEFDPMEQFNVFLKQSEIDAKAVELGLAKNTTEVDKNARAQATLALLTEQSGAAQGQFGRESDTAAGRLAIMEAQTQNAKDALGEGMLPVMSQVAGVLGGAATKFSEFNDSTGGAAATVLAYGTITLGAVGAVSTFVGWIIKLKTNISDTIGAMRDAAGGAAGLARNITMGAGAAAAGALAVMMWTDRMNEAQAAADGLGKKIKDASTSASSFDEFNRTMEETHRQALGLAQQAGSIRSPLDLDYGAELLKGADATQKATQEQMNLEREVYNYANANRVSVEVAYAEITAKQKAEQATADKAAAEAEATAGMNETEKQQWKMNEAIDASKKAYDDAAKARDEFWNPGFDLEEASIAAQQGHADLAAAIAENGLALDITTEAGRNNRSAFLDSAQAALDEAEALKANGASNQEAAAAAIDHVNRLKDQMIQAGFSREAVEMLTSALHLTPRDINIQFQTPGLDLASQKAADLLAAMAKLSNGDYSLANLGSNIGSGIAGLSAGRAAGGSTMPYSVHPITENGSEVVSTPSGNVLVMGNEGGSVTPVANAQAGQTLHATIVVQLDGATVAKSQNRYNLAVS